jgi:hypothetical protein
VQPRLRTLKSANFPDKAADIKKKIQQKLDAKDKNNH